MQSRDWRAFLEDMVECCQKVQQYTDGMRLSAFRENQLVHDATVRNLEILGEAAKHIPSEIRDELPSIEWRRITGLRDVLAHGYFSLEDEILWEVIRVHVPILERQLREFLDSLNE